MGRDIKAADNFVKMGFGKMILLTKECPVTRRFD
jgi:hypothetical protein